MTEFSPGSMVILEALPDGLAEALPEDDLAAIEAMVGQPVMLVGYSFGQAEITFSDSEDDDHSIWVDPSFLRAL